MSAADGLRALADELDAGRAGPARGQAPRRAFDAVVVPVAVHDAVCGWRVATGQPAPDDDVMCCAGCGLAYPHAEVRSVRDELVEGPHWSPPGRSFRASR